MNRVPLAVCVLTTGIVVGGLTTSLVRAQPPDPEDPVPATAFSVHMAIGNCVPDQLAWEKVFIDGGMASSDAMWLACPLDIGPGELPLTDLGWVTIYGYDGADTGVTKEVVSFIAVNDLSTGKSAAGPDASSTGEGNYVLKVVPPDLAGFTTRTAATLWVYLPQPAGNEPSSLRGYVLDVP